MSAGYFDKPIRFATGLIASGAAIEVRDTSGTLADIFSNASLTTPVSNPGVVGADGRYEFYALFGVYDITVGTGASAATYRFKLAGDNVNFLTRADFVSAVADGYAPPGGTVVTIGRLSWMVIPVGHAAYGADPISDLPGWMAVGAWMPGHHGASGDGATDDTVALQGWLDAVGDDVAQADPSKVYVISDTLSVSGAGLRLRGKLRLFKNSNGKALELQNTVSGPYSIASDYAAGDLSIDLTGSPLAAAPKSGQAFKIVSDAVDPGNRDEGSLTTQYRVGEWFVVGSGSTTTSLVLTAPLKFTTGISPTSTAGDEARVDAYTTALNARVVMIDMDNEVDIEGIDVEYEDGHDATPWTGDAIRIVGYAHPKIGFYVKRSYGPGLSMTNFGGTVAGHAERCEDDTASGQYGYGVSDSGSYNLKIIGLTGHDNRHLQTSAATRMSADESDPHVILTAGRTQGSQIIGGSGTGGVSAIWDTHHSTDGMQYSNIRAENGGWYGGSFRGRDLTVDGIDVVGCEYGVQFFTEYDSGDADDDLFTAGKTADDFTSGRISNARIECRGHVLKASHATVDIGGTGDYRSDDHNLLKQEGGRVVISGYHKFTVTGNGGDAGISIFDLDNVNAAASAVWSVTELFIAPGAYIEIDATAGATGLDLFGLEANCKITCYGTIIADVPDASSSLANGAGDGNVFVFGDGLIVYKEGGVVVERVVAPGEPITPEEFGAVGDGVTSDAAAFQEAFDHLEDVGGGTLRGVPGKNYVIDATTYLRASDVLLDFSLCNVTVPNHDIPVISLSDPSDATVAPDNIELRGGTWTQTETQADINGLTFYGGAQPEDYKVASLIHRGKGSGKTLLVRDIEAVNFVNVISDYGDWQNPATTPSGTLIISNIKSDGCNFGLWTPGLTHLAIDGWHNENQAFVQISGGVTLPPHVVYSTDRTIGATNYYINNIYDKTSLNGGTVKLKGVTGGTVNNVRGDGVPCVVELLSCVNMTGTGHILENQSNDPALSETQAALIMKGCHHCHLEGYTEQDATGAHSFVGTTDEETGGLGVNIGCSVRLRTRKTNNAYVSWVDNDEGGTVVHIDHLYIATGATSGVHTTQRNDAGYTPANTRCIVGAIEMQTPASLIVGYVESGATDAVIEYDPMLSNATAHTISDSGTGTSFAAKAHQTRGTWTVTVSDASGNTSATTKAGDWMRVGNTVHLGFLFLGNIDTTGMTAGDEIRIGLPFTASNDFDAQMLPVSFANMGSTTGSPQYLFLRVAGGADYGVLRGSSMTGAESAQIISNISSGVTDLQSLGGSYVVDG